MRLRNFTTLLCLIPVLAAAATSKDSLQAVEARMDKAASEFKSMTANVTRVTHTDVIDENSTETGTVVMKKVQSGEVQGLMDIQAPDRKTYAFEKRGLRIYYPKIKTIEEWNLGKYGEQLDQFVMIGFGTSGTALARDYAMTVLGTETVKDPQDVQTIHLRLVPKAGEAQKHVKAVELWIPESGEPYPVQEKISLTSGDYSLITYTNLKMNAPLPADALQLKVPSGVKTELGK